MLIDNWSVNTGNGDHSSVFTQDCAGDILYTATASLHLLYRVLYVCDTTVTGAGLFIAHLASCTS